MTILAIPAVVLACISLLVGCYNLFVYLRIPSRREYLTFALTCLAIFLYDVFSAGLYNSGHFRDAVFWQQGQLFSLSVFGIAFIWFIADLTETRPGPGVWIFTLLFLAGLGLELATDATLVIRPGHPLTKVVALPFGRTVTYYEAELGPLGVFGGMVLVALLGYAFLAALKYYKKGRRRRAGFLMATLSLLFLAMINDALVASGWHSFIYVFEYAYLGLVFLMGFSLVDDAVRGARMAEDLARSEWRYRLLAENTRDVIWTADLNLEINYCSPSVSALRGYTVEETLAQPLDQVLTPPSYEHAQNVFARVMDQQARDPEAAPRSMTLELEYQIKGGGTVWTEVTVAFTRDEADRPTGLVGITRDISRRKEMQMRLTESEAHLRSVFEAARNVAFVSMDLDEEDPRITDFSSGAENLLGYKKEEVVGRRAAMLHAPEDWEKISAAVRFFGNEAAVSREATLFGRSRGRVPALVTLQPILNNAGKRVGILEVALDIAQLKAAQSALVTSEERYRTILESIEEAYYEVDLAGNFTFFNHALAEITGYLPDELLGMNNRVYTSPETARQMMRVFGRVYSTGEPARISHYEIICKGGKIKTLELSAALIRDEKGNPSGFRGIVRDVSERAQAEEERKQLSERHEQAQKMEALGTLAGGIAHDFNNLLMGLQGNISLILLEADRNLPFYERLQSMEDYVRTAVGLTRQLLGFARGGRFEPRSTDMNELMDRTAEMFGRTKKELRIHRRFARDAWPVYVDVGQMEQVLLNLYVNASQAMPDGGDMFLSTENVALAPDFTKPHNLPAGRYLKVTVRDTGMGMDEETARKAFDPFFTTKERGRGTGLGLATAYGIIKGHDGIITAHGVRGEGATLTLFLPVASDAPETLSREGGTVERGSETILLVDDEDMILETSGDMLRVLGYTVIPAKGGREAVRILKENPRAVDLVILDMVMPDMMGGETFDRLREVRPDVRVLLCSGYAMNVQAAQIIKKGCSGFIQKPFPIEVLSKKLREILSES